MRSRRIRAAIGAALMALICAGVVPGCGSSGEQIPLAKVPPPPEGFARVQSQSKIPRGASPQNANDMRR